MKGRTLDRTGGRSVRGRFPQKPASFWLLLFAVACLWDAMADAQPARLSTASPTTARARVVVVEEPGATLAYQPAPEKIHALVGQGIVAFTGKASPAEGWRTLVQTGDVVGIKVFSTPGSQVGTRVPVVEGVIQGLLAAHLPASNIIVWDRRLLDLRRAGFGELPSRYGVRLAGSIDSGWTETNFYESSLLGHLVYGDHEFQMKGETVGRKSFVSTLVASNITKIINVSPLLTHNSAGVCGNLYSLAFGSVDNTLRFEGEAGKLATAVPEIYALPGVGEHVVLNIVDALICQYYGEQIGHLHYSAALNQLRFSTDPVALDVLSLEELDRQRALVTPDVVARTNTFDLYRNAEILELGIADRKRIDVEDHSRRP